jgi:hypothetical protein
MDYQDKIQKREIHLSSFENAVKVFLEYDFSNENMRLDFIKKAHADLVAKLEQIEEVYENQVVEDPFKD